MKKFLDISGTKYLINLIKGDISKKADKVADATSGNLAGLDASGNLIDSGKNVMDFTNATDITYAELKTLRDGGDLIVGAWYRITDYITTTSQANTQSAGHRFDIIVRADSNNTLNENAYATHQHTETYEIAEGRNTFTYPEFCEELPIAEALSNFTPEEYDYISPVGDDLYVDYMSGEWIGDFENLVPGTTYNYWTDDTNTKTITFGGSDYFASCNPDVWQLKYCLDNDTDRFAWADTTNGKGVIYYMKDEFGNECPYDFKNIQFRFTSAISQSGIVANKYYYTFSVATGSSDATATDHSLNGSYCYGNKIGQYINNSKLELPFNVFRNTTTTSPCYSNIFGNNCYSNTFSNSCYSNTFGNTCSSNTFGNFICRLTVYESVQYCSVTGGSITSYVQNAQILNGTKGINSSNLLTITFAKNKNYTQLAGLDADGNLRIWKAPDVVLNSGDTMTGVLILSDHPNVNSPVLQAATKGYVDDAVSSITNAEIDTAYDAV